MKHIKRFFIDGEPVEVTFVSKIPGKSIVWGTQERGKITIALGQTADNTRSSLLHEILHECADRADARSRVSETAEENFVTVIEFWLFEVLRDNPELLAYLFPEGVTRAAEIVRDDAPHR